MKAWPTDDYLTITGGTQGIYVNTGAVGGALVADPGLVTTSNWWSWWAAHRACSTSAKPRK